MMLTEPCKSILRVNTWRTDYGLWVVVRANLSNCKIKNVLLLFLCFFFSAGLFWMLTLDTQMTLSRISRMMRIKLFALQVVCSQLVLIL